MKYPILATAFLALASLAAVEAQAQGMGRQNRGGMPRDTQSRDTTHAAAVTPSDPFSSLERELPSLAVDLRLSAAQVFQWSAFERDVRDVAELTRSQRRHLAALREGGEKPPTAVTLVASLAEDERLKAEATTELQHHLEALYAQLDDGQKLTLDRRVVLSQSDPLGR